MLTDIKQILGLVTSGAILTFLWNLLKDEEGKRQAVLSGLRELASSLDDNYRSVKQIKRMIRSRQINTINGASITGSFLEDRMDALSAIQLRVEVVRNAIRNRTDMIGEVRRNRIKRYLNYSADYLHDVVEEFEKGTITRDGECYVIGPECQNLIDFLGPRWNPQSEQAETMFKAFMDGDYRDEKGSLSEESVGIKLSFQERFEAFRSLLKIDDVISLTRKTKSISDECMLQAMRELRSEVMLSKPLVPLSFFRHWPSAQ